VIIEWMNYTIQGLINFTEATSGSRLMRIARVSRLLKVRKMRHLIVSITKRIKSNAVLALLGMSRVIVVTLIACHVMACAWYAATSDYRSSEYDGVSLEDRYAASFHWVVSQMGFGTSLTAPETYTERVVANFVSGACMILVAYLLASVVNGLGRMAELNASREQEDHMRMYFSSHDISWTLRNRIWTFLEKYRREDNFYIQESSVQLIPCLPRALVVELRCEVYMPVLTVHPFFSTYSCSEAPKEAMQTIIEKRVVGGHTVATEHELFVEGQDSIYMYFTVQGRLGYYMSLSDEAQLDIVEHQPSGQSTMSTDDDTLHAKVAPGQWMCEQALWLDWKHTGWARAWNNCEFVTIDGEKFIAVFNKDLPQAAKYARKFYEYARASKASMNDVFVDKARLWVIAQEVFEPLLAFEIQHCRPEVPGQRTSDISWEPKNNRTFVRVWQSAWREGNLQNRSGLLRSMTMEMKCGTVLMYQTLFAMNLRPPSNAISTWISPEEIRLHDLRVMFLKRLLLAFVVCGLTFTSDTNGSRHRSWPFPMASALCHGSRVMVRLNGVPWKKFLAFLFLGNEYEDWNWDEKGPPPAMYQRRAATHSVKMGKDGPREVRLKGLQTHQALSQNHLGMDLPLGGLGNPGPTSKTSHGCMVGPSGVPFRKSRGDMRGPCAELRKKTGQKTYEYVSSIQHGHLYVRWDDFGSQCTRKLVVGRKSGSRSTTVPDGEKDQSRTNSYAHARSSQSSVAGPDCAQLLGWLREQRHRSTVATKTGSIDDSDYVDLLSPYGKGSPTVAASPGQASVESQVFLQQEWTTVAIGNPRDMQAVLLEAGLQNMAKDQELFLPLFDLVSKRQELSIEKDANGQIRAFGTVIFLSIVVDHGDGRQPKVLLHSRASATASQLNSSLLAQDETVEEQFADADDLATSDEGLMIPLHSSGDAHEAEMDVSDDPVPRGSRREHGSDILRISSRTTSLRKAARNRGRGGSQLTEASAVTGPSSSLVWLQDQRTVDDVRTAVVTCLANEDWTVAVTRFCEQVLRLDDDAIEVLLDSVSGKSGELFTSEISCPETFCHYHRSACGSLPLKYMALHMQVKIRPAQRHMFKNLQTESLDEFVTIQEDMDLAGFGGLPRSANGPGVITREWEWMSLAEANREGVVGIAKPEDATDLMLEKKEKRICTLLMGIEASAPLKEDFFGEAHTASGVSKAISAFGKRKWRDYRKGGQDVPADLGGMHMHVDWTKLQILQWVCEQLNLVKPSDGVKEATADSLETEKQLFKDILEDNQEGSLEKLRRRLESTTTAPQVRSQR